MAALDSAQIIANVETFVKAELAGNDGVRRIMVCFCFNVLTSGNVLHAVS